MTWIFVSVCQASEKESQTPTWPYLAHPAEVQQFWLELNLFILYAISKAQPKIYRIFLGVDLVIHRNIGPLHFHLQLYRALS